MSHITSLGTIMQQLVKRVSPSRPQTRSNMCEVRDSTRTRASSVGEVSASPQSRPLIVVTGSDDDDSDQHCKLSHIGRKSKMTRLSRHSVIQSARVQWALFSPRTRLFCKVAAILLCICMTAGISDCLLSDYRDPNGQYISLDENFAVVINTYKRPQQLAEAVRHYGDQCGGEFGVDHIYIIWAETDVNPPSPLSFFLSAPLNPSRPAVTIVKVANSLNSRFAPIAGIQDSVFMVDDDIRVECEALRAAFFAWKSYPNSMVGYYPRLAQVNRRSLGKYVYQSWPIVYWRNQMNFILTKACFLHSRYMDMYTSNDHPAEIKAYVDKYFNCEDVAMSLLVANVTKAETGSAALPIYVEGNVVDKGLFNGISTGTGHMVRRSECLTDLTAIYRKHGWDEPLDATVSLRESSWFRHVPGFWWQSQPSNIFEWFALSNIFQ